MIFHRLITGAVIASALLLGMQQAAQATELFNIGSTFVASGQTSAGTWSDTVTLQDGTTPVDAGALNLTISIVDGANEWLVFSYQTPTPGTPVMSDTSDYWSAYETGLDALMATDFEGAFIEFLDSNGNAMTPTGNIFPGYSVMTNPVPGGAGTGVGALGFTDDNAPGPYFALGADIDPFSYLDSQGVPSADVDGFVEAWEFAPQTSTPEPSSFALLAVALLSLLVGRAFSLRRPFQSARSFFLGITR